MHLYSFSSVKIDAISVEPSGVEHVRSASGFVANHDGENYLVTNWHVASGLHFQTNEILDTKTYLRPIHFRIKLPLASLREGNEITWHMRTLPDIDLYDDPDCFLAPRYVSHPKHGQNIDVVAIHLLPEYFPDGLEVIPVDIQTHANEDIKLEVMQTVFVVGHPLKSSVTPNSFPIYKVAAISTEPNIYDALPIILIDGKTKPGMSGSFVVVRPGTEIDKTDEAATTIISGRTRVVGVYSGRDRIGDDLYTSELGIMWPNNECLLPILKSFDSMSQV